MAKILSTTLFLLIVLYPASLMADPSELDIRWQDQKLSVKAKGVTVCQVLEELAEKTNTKIRNNNKCDNLVILNIKEKSFDEAIKRILKNHSYVLVDEGNARKLLVYDKNQQDSNIDTHYDRASEQVYMPESQSRPLEQYEETNSPDANNSGSAPMENSSDTWMPNTQEPTPYPTDPEPLQNYGDDVPATDPNDTSIDPEGLQPDMNP